MILDFTFGIQENDNFKVGLLKIEWYLWLRGKLESNVLKKAFPRLLTLESDSGVCQKINLLPLLLDTFGEE